MNNKPKQNDYEASKKKFYKMKRAEIIQKLQSGEDVPEGALSFIAWCLGLRESVGPTDSFTPRDEANAITAHAFRNGFLEDLHAGKHSELLENPEFSRITDKEMKKLMIEASAGVEKLLRMKSASPEKYAAYIQRYNAMYCRHWERVAESYELETLGSSPS